MEKKRGPCVSFCVKKEKKEGHLFCSVWEKEGQDQGQEPRAAVHTDMHTHLVNGALSRCSSGN